MMKFVPAILAVATLGLGSAAFAQGTAAPATPQSKPSATAPSGAATKSLSEAEVRKELEKQGYNNIGDVKRKGDKYEAQAMKDGKRVSLDVDAATGKAVAR
jgi:hypothetical protein